MIPLKIKINSKPPLKNRTEEHTLHNDQNYVSIVQENDISFDCMSSKCIDMQTQLSIQFYETNVSNTARNVKYSTTDSSSHHTRLSTETRTIGPFTI
jgi:hypothetical protein